MGNAAHLSEPLKSLTASVLRRYLPPLLSKTTISTRPYLSKRSDLPDLDLIELLAARERDDDDVSVKLTPSSLMMTTLSQKRRPYFKEKAGE